MPVNRYPEGQPAWFEPTCPTSRPEISVFTPSMLAPFGH
ncbi:MAG: hypothetical protein JWP26_1224 [Devosia sp.]|nr:hypothetical protein [Devosia sp.]